MKNNTFGCHVDRGRGPRSLSTAYLSRVDPPPVHRAAGFLKFWFKESMKNNTFGCHVDRGRGPRSLSTPRALTLLTWKCASHHNHVHFFDISTSKSGPAPLVFSTFWLGSVFRATTAYLSRVDPLPVHRAAGFLKFWLKKYEKQYFWLSRRPGEGPALLKYGVLKQGGPPPRPPGSWLSEILI